MGWFDCYDDEVDNRSLITKVKDWYHRNIY
jgi:hypothetical protein